MAKITLDPKFMKNELDLPWSAVEDKVVDNSRWSVQHEIIFEYDGKFYITSYSVGATEMQDESPWEYDKTVDCWEVVKKPVTVEQWVEVKD